MTQVKKTAALLIVFLVCATLVCLGASYAMANEKDLASEAMDSAAPLDNANDFEETENGLTAADENQNVTVQESDSDAECFFDSDDETKVSASFQLADFSNETLADDSKVKLDSSNGTSAIIEASEGTVRTSFVITNDDAPGITQ